MLPTPTSRPRVCAVSFLNTTPLVWGMLQGPQQGLFDIQFRLPSECADALASGDADIGIVPSFELTRQNLQVLNAPGIACRGPVRSILLVSSRPPSEIRTLAADTSSRTSVQLARVILERRYHAEPVILPHPPDLPAMLRTADAALLIGDPALRIDRAHLTHHTYDLGSEWFDLTGLPMVFAVWAGRPGAITPEIEQLFRDSAHYGRDHMEDIVAAESPRRGFPPQLVRDYLTRHILYDLGPQEQQAMSLFLSYARSLRATEPVSLA